MKNKLTGYLLDHNVISFLDYHFAKFATGLSGRGDSDILLAAALVSSKTREGHICINLEEYADKCLIEEDELTRCPELEVWLEKLNSCGIVGRPGDFEPMILDDKNRLYLYRYWAYEDRIAKYIKEFVNGSNIENGVEEISEKLSDLFPGEKSPDLQKLAAYTAMIKKITIISGGPGTGKTTTVAKLLALLIEQSLRNDEGRPTDIKIMLTAPTGKAAARLQESIRNFKQKAKADGLKISEEVLNSIPEEASTIHRLLGSIPNSPYFKHNKKNPLKLDVLVADEASMIDVALMAKLLEALPEHAKLIILGDKDQLSSVEAGKFMGDVCTSALMSNYSAGYYKAFKSITGVEPEDGVIGVDPGDGAVIGNGHSLRDCFIHLKKSYRFDNNSGIGELSRLVNEGNSKAAIELLRSCGGQTADDGLFFEDDLFGGSGLPQKKFSDISMKNISSEEQLEKELKDTVKKHFSKYLAAAEYFEKHPDENNLKNVFKLFDQFRVLCAMREGPFGVNRINMLIESILRDEHMISTKRDWYRGMPVMITQNSYGVNLFNGDVGIVLPDNESNGKLKAFFPSEDTYRKLHQLRLPEYEKVYAMTVHKSQGSEFDHVVLVLPDRQNPVLTRELLYTGLTRAKSMAEIWSSEKIFMDTIESNIKRSSGLYDALCSNN